MHFKNWSPEYLERYHYDGDYLVVEVAIDGPFDLYDDKDPSPLKARDLKPSVEAYITNCVREIPFAQKMRIDFYFYEFTGDDKEVKLLEKSVRDFFIYQSRVRFVDFKFSIKNGLRSLSIGFIFLFLCIFISHTFLSSPTTLVATFFLEGLSVLGWVSLWNPVQVFLYEIWPIIGNSKTLKRCSTLEMRFQSIEALSERRRYLVD